MRARKGKGIGQREDRIKKHKMSNIDQNLSKSRRTASQPPKVTPKKKKTFETGGCLPAVGPQRIRRASGPGIGYGIK